jgi:predicted ribosomally synthesized six-cysteine peptide SCIFF
MLDNLNRENKNIKTITVMNLKRNIKRCCECQTSCQSACKTSCTIANQVCENKNYDKKLLKNY